MEYQRTVSIDKQLRFAGDNNMTSHNVSARTGENVSKYNANFETKTGNKRLSTKVVYSSINKRSSSYL